MVNNLKKYWLELTVIVAFLTYTGFINFTLTEGSNLHYGITAHDEYVAVNEVYNILHPFSAKHLFMAVTTGSIQYYGRAMFYTDAIFAFLPEKIWGLSGMVVAIRCFHALLLTISFFILAKTLLQQQFYRIVFLIGALFTYWSIYFGLIPKPEPHQFLAFAIFLWYFKKNNYGPGLYFTWLGIAYGLKISFLVVVPIFFFVSLYSVGFKLKSSVRALFCFLVGLAIANPYILIGLVKPVFLQAYFKNNFILIKYKTQSIYKEQMWMLVGGLFLIIPVAFLSKRLYPHYFWPGYIFLFLGIVSAIEQFRINEFLKPFISLCIVYFALSYSSKTLTDLWQNRFIVEMNSQNEEKCIESVVNSEKASVVAQDLGVFYKFQDLVQNYRYHPFGSAIPQSLKYNRRQWYSSMSMEDMSTLMPDIIILSNKFKTSKYFSLKNCFFQQRDFHDKYELVNQSCCNNLYFYKKTIK
jgi:hypothetical protein